MPKICTAWISWEKSFNLKVLSIANSKHKLGSAKHVCDVPSTKTSFSDTNTYWCSCVSTPWAYIVNVPPYYSPGLSTMFSVGGQLLGTGIFVEVKLSCRKWNQAGKFILTASAWCPPPPFRNPYLQLQFFLFVQTVPYCLIINLVSWFGHFIYDNVIQILVYEKNWHTLTLFSWALIDA